MAEEFGFSRITVTPHEEEETVIRVGPAGAASVSSSGRAEAAADSVSNEPLGKNEGAKAARPSPEDARAEAAADVADDMTEDASAKAAEASEAAAPTAREKMEKRAEDSYRETTLEDLERRPMPLAQKIVIIAAILLLVGFAVYYVFIM